MEGDMEALPALHVVLLQAHKSACNCAVKQASVCLTGELISIQLKCTRSFGASMLFFIRTAVFITDTRKV